MSSLAADKLRELERPEPWRFFLRLGADWLALAAGFAFFAWQPNVFGFLAASVVIGFAQHGIAVLGHEAVHFRICQSRFFNEWIGRVFCMFPVGLTVSSYRDFHFPHHRDPFGPGDPEVPLRQALGANFRPPFTLRRGFTLWALSFLGFSVKEMVTFAAMMPFGKLSERLWLLAFWGATLAFAWHTGTLLFAGLWVFSLSTTYFSMLRIQGWYEHGLEGQATNRYSLPNPLYRLLVPHNIWVHYEHHKYPAVPCYNLEAVRVLDESDKIWGFDDMVGALKRVEQLEGPAAKEKTAA